MGTNGWHRMRLAVLGIALAVEVSIGAAWLRSLRDDRIRKVLELQQKADNDSDFWFLLKMEQLERARLIALASGMKEIKRMNLHRAKCYRKGLEIREDRIITAEEKEVFSGMVRENLTMLLEGM